MAERKFQKEEKGLDKLISKLPAELKNEIKNLWLDFEKGLTREGRFFKQADRIESFLQAMEYWQKYKIGPQGPWWVQARELIDDPVLIEFIKEMEKKFHRKTKPRV